MKLPPIRHNGVTFFRGKEWILTFTLEKDGYFNHQVGDIIRVHDREMQVDVFYCLTRRARDEEGVLLPVYEVEYIQPEEVFADLPTIDYEAQNRPAQPSE